MVERQRPDRAPTPKNAPRTQKPKREPEDIQRDINAGNELGIPDDFLTQLGKGDPETLALRRRAVHFLMYQVGDFTDDGPALAQWVLDTNNRNS